VGGGEVTTVPTNKSWNKSAWGRKNSYTARNQKPKKGRLAIDRENFHEGAPQNKRKTVKSNCLWVFMRREGSEG